MAIGEICNREVVVVEADASVAEAASLMRQFHVGDLVVVRETDGRNEPIGIVTDRDLVLEVLAEELDPGALSVSEIMGAELVKVKEDTGVFEAIRFMREKGVRRMPVVDDSGALAGIVSLDDLLEVLSEELVELSRLTRAEHKREADTRH
ncbi:MAG TPA: CBS domain-containing protein [Gallionellaceae bacterium]|nr:CBS domain-containing protein [Gallionellaceae bacterium]